MRVLRATLPVLALWLGLAVSATRAAERVELALVLAPDALHSVDAKFRPQCRGYAAAITDPHVIAAVRSGPRRRIAVEYNTGRGLASTAIRSSSPGR